MSDQTGLTPEQLKQENAKLREALEPFANCVFNDNGDVTYDYSNTKRENYFRAYNLLRTLAPQSGGMRG